MKWALTENVWFQLLPLRTHALAGFELGLPPPHHGPPPQGPPAGYDVNGGSSWS